MMGRQARASAWVMRLWKPHDLGRSCLCFTIRHHVTNETEPQNAGALGHSLIVTHPALRTLQTVDQLVQPGGGRQAKFGIQKRLVLPELAHRLRLVALGQIHLD
jgi:hypothetical protein